MTKKLIIGIGGVSGPGQFGQKKCNSGGIRF